MPIQQPRPAPVYGTPWTVVATRKLEPYWVEMFDGSGEKKVLLVLAGKNEKDTRMRFLDLTNSPLLGSLRPASKKLYEILSPHIDGVNPESEVFEGEDHQLPDVLAAKITPLASEKPAGA